MARAKVKKKTARAAKAAKVAKKPARKVTRTTAKPRRKPAAKPAPKASGGRGAASGAGLRALAQRIIDVTIADDDAGMLGLYAESIESSEAGTAISLFADGGTGAFWTCANSIAVALLSSKTNLPVRSQ